MSFFLSLFLDFFTLWAHIFPYTYRGQDIKHNLNFEKSKYIATFDSSF